MSYCAVVPEDLTCMKKNVHIWLNHTCTHTYVKSELWKEFLNGICVIIQKADWYCLNIHLNTICQNVLHVSLSNTHTHTRHNLLTGKRGAGSRPTIKLTLWNSNSNVVSRGEMRTENKCLFPLIRLTSLSSPHHQHLKLKLNQNWPRLCCCLRNLSWKCNNRLRPWTEFPFGWRQQPLPCNHLS